MIRHGAVKKGVNKSVLADSSIGSVFDQLYSWQITDKPATEHLLIHLSLSLSP